jgi:hypothetical protein
MNLKKGYAFIIDTNEYAGNFERELTAYCTGIIGECEVGEEFIDKEITSIFEPYILQVVDEYGCYRPCEIVQNSEGFYYSVAIYFDEKPSNELITLMKVRANQFNNIQILGFRLLEIKQNQTEIEI